MLFNERKIASSSLRVLILERNTPSLKCDTKKLSSTVDKQELLRCLRFRNTQNLYNTNSNVRKLTLEVQNTVNVL